MIDALLKGYHSKDLDTTPLRPKPGEDGGWSRVLNYCADADFKSAFNNPSLFVVIQVDTDVFRTDQVSPEFMIPDAANLSTLELVARVRDLLIRQITQPFYDGVANRILFAIAVNEIECWFLAPYNQADKRPEKNAQNCIYRLNTGIKKAGGNFFIPEKDKKPEPYYKLVRCLKRRRDILAYSKANESFAAFVAEMQAKLPLDAPTDDNPDVAE